MIPDVGHIIVADIGGTNARFATVQRLDSGYHIANRWTAASAGFNRLEEALASYIASLPKLTIKGCSLAVAGPIKNGAVTLTNLGWSTSVSELKERFKFEFCTLINDFSALSYSLPFLNQALLSSIYSGSESLSAKPLNGLKTIIGPGTGFGVSSLMSVGSSWVLIDGEGGHASFAPESPLEIELLKVLSQRFPRVSIEAVSSGGGIVNLYQALAIVRGEQAQKLSPQAITALGSTGKDDLCEQALHSFCEILGSVAGDIALLNLPVGGLYLGGGILPKIEEFLRNSDFTKRFLAKQPMSHLLKDIPINLIVSDDAAFIGAAAALDQP